MNNTQQIFRMSLTVMLLTLLPLLVYGQTKAPLVVQRLRGPIILDGVVNEPAWDAIQPFPMTMYSPKHPGEPTERTEFRIAYDDDYLYISGRMYDSDPSGVQANSLVRDIDRGGDFMNVFLDTFTDKQSMVAFMTTPAGNRLDAEVINDAEGDDFWNIGWNSYWDCAVTQNNEGWFAEMRIPFSSLRFQDDHGKVVFGFIIHRLINRKNERDIFPDIAPKKAFSGWKASLAQEIVLEGIYRKNPVYFSPYVLGGNEYSTLVNTNNLGYASQEKFAKELGFDLKYGFTNNMTLDLTANTDFAQVESDDQQINLTRYSLFYPERRQFFQERSGIFDFKYAGQNRLFHSRKIGLTDDGKPVRILGGARMVGRVGDWDLGFLDMQTEKNFGLPSENFSVLRLRRNIINQDSHIGSMITGRFGNDGSYNVAVGVDGRIRVFDADYFSTQIIQLSRNDLAKQDFFRQSVLNLDWERRTAEGLGGNLTALYVGDQYDPGIGFNLRKGITGVGGNILYGWFVNENPVFRKHTPSLSWGVFVRNGDHSIESSTVGGTWTVDLKSGTSASLTVNSMQENLWDQLQFSDKAIVPAGKYTFYNVKATYFISPGYLLRSNFTVEDGTFYDGNRFSLDIAPTWNISRYLEIGGEYLFNRIRFSNRNQELNAHIGRIRIQGALNSQFSVILLTQYNSEANIVGSNIRVRYNFREGVD
ncbi:MAG: carbohydrate binding family 9 domain-containing protein, partial [Ignavibacteriales bacterium]|nr:carbohydrate binding family 9 domain-containing protein [Ignavibacteriales bacterium]